MNKKLLIILCILLLTILTGCFSNIETPPEQPEGNATGTLILNLSSVIENKGIGPSDELVVDSYKVSLTGPETMEPILTSETTLEISLQLGEWVVTVEALDASGNIIAVDKIEDINITSNNSSTITSTPALVQSTEGKINITVVWPESLTIPSENIQVFFDSDIALPIDSEKISYTINSVNFYSESIESGNDHWIRIVLLDNGTGDQDTVYENIYVYDNLETSAVYNRTLSDFHPVSAKVAEHDIVHELWSGNIPEADIQRAIDELHIVYWHTSHGSQLTKGMEAMSGFADNGNLGGENYTSNLFRMDGDGLDLREPAWLDLGSEDSNYELIWEETTRSYLDAHSDINVVVWAWCGSLSGWDNERVQDNYIDTMNQLETDYPGIVFVYMTGHAESGGVNGNTITNNEYIRNYCEENDKWLYDFYDIECWDPDGKYYGDLLVTDGCNYDADGSGVTEEIDSDGDDAYEPTGGDANWAMDWQDSHIEGTDWFDCVSTHTQPLNGNMKAFASWWLFVQIANSI